MPNEISRRDRRTVIIVNYVSLIGLTAAFYAGGFLDWAGLRVAAIIVGAVLVLTSFIYVYWRTGLWKLVHTRFDRLDEREAQVIYNSLRYSYGTFAVICLVIIYAMSLSGRNIGVLPAFALVYFAHILPASIIAWTEKQVLIGE